VSPPPLGAKDALIIVDVQKDFCLGGALAVEEGDRVVGVVNRWLAEAERAGAAVVASRDWHPADHVSFRERGGPWPPHCIQGTSGAGFHEDLCLPDDAWVVSKGTTSDRDAYSAFDETGLLDRLKARGVERVWIGGLALDVCVRATALDAQSAGFETHVIREATRPVDRQAGERTLEELRAAGAVIE
jgi:nicotinamidase/pyrazinamidase